MARRSDPIYGAIRDHEHDEVARILGDSFGFEPEGAAGWLTSAGYENIRVLRRDGVPVATLFIVPMGQYFGGRSVPMAGIAAVGTAPEARGRGVGTELMRRTMREIARSGVALSCLYPATQTLYRRVGFEQAGARYRVRVKARDVGDGDRALSVRQVEPGDEGAIHRLYSEVACRRDGWLDRGPYVWSRVPARREKRVVGYVAERDGRIDGYVYFWHQRGDWILYDIHLNDFVARTEGARQRLLTFLGDHRSVAGDVIWYGPASDSRLAALPEQRYRVELNMHWMLRVVDVVAALEARGYPRGLTASLHLAVRDDLVRKNVGRFVLTVEGGSGRVRKGGRGTVVLGVRALASMYSGFASPWALAERGEVDASPKALDSASAVFAGPAPSMADMF